jgi:hypothetical protein
MFLIALIVTVAGIPIVYNVNSWAWFAVEPSGQIYFRAWVLLVSPLVLSVAALGFAVPLLGYFVLIPAICCGKQSSLLVRFMLSTLVFATLLALVRLVSLLF